MATEKKKPTKFEDLDRALQGLVVDYALCSRPPPRANDRTAVLFVLDAVRTVVRNGDAFGWVPLDADEIAQLRAIVDRRLDGYEPAMRLAQYQTVHALQLLAGAIKQFALRHRCWTSRF